MWQAYAHPTSTTICTGIKNHEGFKPLVTAIVATTSRFLAGVYMIISVTFVHKKNLERDSLIG